MEPDGQARVERRLAAILAADVAGYSRLIEADEVGTLSRLKGLRAEVIDPKIAGHRGRIVKTTGDGLLIEFPSVIEAVSPLCRQMNHAAALAHLAPAVLKKLCNGLTGRCNTPQDRSLRASRCARPARRRSEDPLQSHPPTGGLTVQCRSHFLSGSQRHAMGLLLLGK
jgi:class 3 adenylate cyclase